MHNYNKLEINDGVLTYIRNADETWCEFAKRTSKLILEIISVPTDESVALLTLRVIPDAVALAD